MTNDEAHSAKLADLRKRAEAELRSETLDMPGMSPDEFRTLVHELRTHQIELEMQNDELRRTQDELIESRDRYADLYDFAPVGYATVKDGGLILEANLALVDMLAVERGRLVKQRLSAFIVADDEDVFYLHRRQLLETGGRHTCELRMQKNGGEPFWAKMESVVVHDTDGNAAGFRTAISDVADRKRAEEALRQAHSELEMRVEKRTAELTAANARLEKEIAERERIEKRSLQLQAELAHVGRLKTMGELGSSLSHELNQPLAAIVTQAEATAYQVSAGDELNVDDLLESLRFLADQGHRAGELIRRMRRFIQSTPVQKTIFHLGEAIDEIIPLVANRMRRAGIEFSLHADPSLPATMADTIQIQQVLMNLIQNAIEAMEGAESENHRLEVRASLEHESIQIAVSDTGDGISEEKTADLDDLFEAFRTTKAEGIGLGLSIARSIVEAHDGRLTAERNPDRGATFSFTLPIATRGDGGEVENDSLHH